MNEYEMLSYLETCYPSEGCLVAIGNVFYPIRNISDTDSTSFVFDSRQLADVMDIGEIDKIIHSHIDIDNTPSPLDIESMKFWSNTTWWIYSIFKGKIDENRKEIQY